MKNFVSLIQGKILGFLFSIILVMTSVFAIEAFPVFAQEPHYYTETELRQIADGIVRWKRLDMGAPEDGNLLDYKILTKVGTAVGGWYPVGLSRLGYTDNYAGYLAVLLQEVEQQYQEPGKLSAVKATDWHRIALAVLAAGGDPTRFGTDGEGNPIDLIADSTYNRGDIAPLERQGINGWIWGLITVDALHYEIPEDAYYQREDLITEILKLQLPDGGFALSGTESDPDITGMAIQALAPYFAEETVYTYEQTVLQTETTKSVKQVIDEALTCLSAMQLETGDFQSWGNQNVESTVQVIVALCCLDIDPQTDPRFIKNGKTPIDGLLRYQFSDGGFVHAFTYDETNPNTLPNASDSMAGEQALYTLAAVIRQMHGMRTLYDFRPEEGEAGETGMGAPAGPSTKPSTASPAEDNSLLTEKEPVRWVIWINVALGVIAAVTVLIFLWRMAKGRKKAVKDLLVVLIVLLLFAILVNSIHIQSVEEYYLTHIDDIREDSETVFLSIRCDSILDHWEDLDPALQSEEFVPPDGIILAQTEYVLRPGDTVYDILSRVVRSERIQMEYQGSEENIFGSVYIQGIHYLYEFSCGPLSGWMYLVNGVYPGYSSSKCVLQDGDVIEWVYSCDLGRDMAANLAGGAG